MSCNGCRVLRKGCSETCVLRSCLHWIESPEAQGFATLFVAKFFGRSDLLSFVSAVSEHQRPALFQSLLFEACGRTVNPVNGALGLLSSGNWHLCRAAVETVLAGGVLRPILGILAGDLTLKLDESSITFNNDACMPQILYFPSLPSLSDTINFQPSNLDLGLDLSLPTSLATKIGSDRGRNNYPMKQRLRDTRSLDSEESEMTSFESGGRLQEHKLLNLFV